MIHLQLEVTAGLVKFPEQLVRDGLSGYGVPTVSARECHSEYRIDNHSGGITTAVVFDVRFNVVVSIAIVSAEK